LCAQLNVGGLFQNVYCDKIWVGITYLTSKTRSPGQILEERCVDNNCLSVCKIILKLVRKFVLILVVILFWLSGITVIS